jgi:O-methyltransferase involved in polyketide biosynthesis
MDTRAFRLDWPPGARLFEMDLPEVLEAKDRVIEKSGTNERCERHAVAVDL